MDTKSRVNYEGTELTLRLAPEHKDPFIYVGESYRVENFRSAFVSHERDFDVLPEMLSNFLHTFFTSLANLYFDHILGAISAAFYLQSDHYVPERLLNKIDKRTSAMMENGMHQFYTSFTNFLRKLFARQFARSDDDDSQALTMSQLKRPMIFIFGLWGVAIIVFIAEIIIFKWKNRSHIEH